MSDTNHAGNEKNTYEYANIQTQGRPDILKRRNPSAAPVRPQATTARPASSAVKTAPGTARPASSAARPTSAGTARPRTATPGPRPASGTSAAPRRAAGQAARPAGTAQKRPAPRRQASVGKGFDLAAIGALITAKFDALMGVKRAPGAGGAPRRGRMDWQMILAVVVMIAILIGIISLCVVGIMNCAGGCNSSSSVGTQTAIINKITDNPNQAGQTVSDTNGGDNTSDTPAVNIITTVPGKTGISADGLRSARIRSIGDFVIHEPIYVSAKKLASSTGTSYSYNFAPMLNQIRSVMENADYTVANVDGPMGGEKYNKYGYRGYPQFNTPPYLLYALKDAGVDMLTLANNHMLDTWYDGLMAEIENVESVGLAHIGANRSMQEKNTPTIVEINGIRVGFMNYTESLNDMDRQPSLNPNALTFGVNATRNSDVSKDAKALKDAGADVIVCYMHWGTEYKEIDANQNIYAKQLVQAGVDVIIGSHPHVVQPAKWLTGTNQYGKTQKTLCLFSLGNFLSDQRLALRDGGIIFDFTIQEQSDGTFAITSPSYLPTWVWRTGADEKNYTYQVLPIAQAMKNRPVGMSDADYNRMVASYQENVAVMNTGSGSCISE